MPQSLMRGPLARLALNLARVFAAPPRSCIWPMIIRITNDHHFYLLAENTPESKFLGWRLANHKRAKDNSYTVDAQEFMTLMRKFTKAKLEDEAPKTE